MLVEVTGLDAKDCYRTPMSGGHKHAGQGDLQISKRMRRLFPFLVECKFYKKIPLMQILSSGPTAILSGWINQARRSEKRELKIRGIEAPWLVVMKENMGPILAVGDWRLVDFLNLHCKTKYKGSLLRVVTESGTVFVVSFDKLLRAIKYRKDHL